MLSVIYLFFLGAGVSGAMLGAAWPSMYEELGVPDSWLGIISMIMMGFCAVASLLSTNVSKKVRTSVIIVTCFLVIAFSYIGFSLTTAFLVLCLIAVPLGIGTGLTDAIVNNFLATNFEARHMNWGHCMWAFGSALGPLILAVGLTSSGSWQWGFLVAGCGLIVFVIYMFVTMRFWKNIADTREQTAVANNRSEKLDYRSILAIPGVKAAIVTIFLYISLEMTIGVWGSTYLVFTKGISPDIAAGWISLFFVGAMLGRIASGFLTIKLSNLALVKLGVIICATGIVIFMLPLRNEVLIAGLILIGFGGGPIMPSLFHETPRLFGKENSQPIISLQVSGSFAGSTIAPPIFGAITSNLGYQIFPIYIAVTLVLLIVLIFLLYRSRKAYL